MTLDLSALPEPQIIETLTYDAIVARNKAMFQNLWAAARVSNPALPDYDVSMLETDPVVILIEALSYQELLLRGRANDVARANLLSFATGANLDQLGSDHGLTRLAGELDFALRERIVLSDQGRSTAGPAEWYALHARSASPLVKDVRVYRSGTGPELTVAILSTDNGGVPSPSLLALVTAAVTAENVRSVNDVITVASAVQVTVNVAAEIWLLPDTPLAVFDGLEAALRASLTLEGGIGFDLNRSWLLARLSPAGVSRVELAAPVDNVVMAANSAAALGTITLTYRGRSR